MPIPRTSTTSSLSSNGLTNLTSQPAPPTAILMHPDAIHCLKRRQLVNLCGRLGLKANGKNTDLIARLQEFAAKNINSAGPTAGCLPVLRPVCTTDSNEHSPSPPPGIASPVGSSSHTRSPAADDQMQSAESPEDSSTRASASPRATGSSAFRATPLPDVDQPDKEGEVPAGACEEEQQMSLDCPLDSDGPSASDTLLEPAHDAGANDHGTEALILSHSEREGADVDDEHHADDYAGLMRDPLSDSSLSTYIDPTTTIRAVLNTQPSMVSQLAPSSPYLPSAATISRLPSVPDDEPASAETELANGAGEEFAPAAPLTKTGSWKSFRSATSLSEGAAVAAHALVDGFRGLKASASAALSPNKAGKRKRNDDEAQHEDSFVMLESPATLVRRLEGLPNPDTSMEDATAPMLAQHQGPPAKPSDANRVIKSRPRQSLAVKAADANRSTAAPSPLQNGNSKDLAPTSPPSMTNEVFSATSASLLADINARLAAQGIAPLRAMPGTSEARAMYENKPSGLKPSASTLTRFDSAHGKAFDQMDSIANHYAAQRGKTSNSTTARSSGRSNPASRRRDAARSPALSRAATTSNLAVHGAAASAPKRQRMEPNNAVSNGTSFGSRFVGAVRGAFRPRTASGNAEPTDAARAVTQLSTATTAAAKMPAMVKRTTSSTTFGIRFGKKIAGQAGQSKKAIGTSTTTATAGARTASPTTGLSISSTTSNLSRSNGSAAPPSSASSFARSKTHTQLSNGAVQSPRSTASTISSRTESLPGNKKPVFDLQASLARKPQGYTPYSASETVQQLKTQSQTLVGGPVTGEAVRSPTSTAVEEFNDAEHPLPRFTGMSPSRTMPSLTAVVAPGIPSSAAAGSRLTSSASQHTLRRAAGSSASTAAKRPASTASSTSTARHLAPHARAASSAQGAARKTRSSVSIASSAAGKSKQQQVAIKVSSRAARPKARLSKKGAEIAREAMCSTIQTKRTRKTVRVAETKDEGREEENSHVDVDVEMRDEESAEDKAQSRDQGHEPVEKVKRLRRGLRRSQDLRELSNLMES
ncbi:hypothetical protein IE81DRAFT_323375 [Ceraceosorus guamensis]|uniref:SAP domain-containing protein n=1 Tax=Ceraceosorus guamensis TaxID=1522189 RepID=A0A316VZ80_9BASI|nr:hypothetical protein IE81DRAFT_323375 [Ceraceosorus guamensis]PWN42614.1 hypothetical protein IE81DRAFT_323375 [Ceraceosorus guamensis]